MRIGSLHGFACEIHEKLIRRPCSLRRVARSAAGCDVGYGVVAAAFQWDDVISARSPQREPSLAVRADHAERFKQAAPLSVSVVLFETEGFSTHTRLAGSVRATRGVSTNALTPCTRATCIHSRVLSAVRRLTSTISSSLLGMVVPVRTLTRGAFLWVTTVARLCVRSSLRAARVAESSAVKLYFRLQRVASSAFSHAASDSAWWPRNLHLV